MNHTEKSENPLHQRLPFPDDVIDLSSPGAEARFLTEWIMIHCRGEAFARRHASVFGWNQGESSSKHFEDNGTCCLVQTRTKRFLTTCAHVFKGFEDFRAARPKARLWLSLIAGEPLHSPAVALEVSNLRLIDIDERLDLATVSFDKIDSLEDWRFCRVQSGPISRVCEGDKVQILGFPGDGLRAGISDNTLNHYFELATVHSVGRQKFLLHSPRDSQHHRNMENKECSPVRIGGLSGAPVFKVDIVSIPILVGIVTDLCSNGLGDSPTRQYEMSDGDIYAVHANFIQKDGLISTE
jgi:hypothetical protein